MPITSHTGPAGGRAAMEQALRSRRRGSRVDRAALSGAPQVGSPIPVYHLALGDLVAAGSPWDRLSMTSWRYPVLGGLEPGLADVRENGAEPARFGGLLQGLVARRLFQASQLAEVALGSDAEAYEPRLLDVPSLQFLALWLHASATDSFVALLEGTPPGSAPLRLVPDVLQALRQRAAGRARRAVQPLGTAQAPPTN